MLLKSVNFALPRITLAADARLSRVDYTDDQAWDLLPGALDNPALVLQTRYGGRVGMANLVPMWTLLDDQRTLYLAQAYAQPPRITAFAPGYARVEAGLTPELTLTADYWVMESHAVGARYTLRNTGTAPVALRLDLFAQVLIRDKAVKLAIATLANGLNALSFGRLENLEPAVMLENATATPASSGKRASPKIGVDLSIPAGDSISVRWVHGGAESLRTSLALAEAWLKADWDAHFTRIAQMAVAIPMIETGNSAWDTALAMSYHQVMQAVMKGGGLPHPSLVATRQPGSGYSANGDGTDHDRAWSGQTPSLSYLAAPALATVDMTLAQGIVRNFIAVQEANGAIDGKPGLAGQRQGSLAIPLLARLTNHLVTLIPDNDHQTGFIRETLPALVRFYEHWLSAQDADGDGFPEWLNERQSGYVYFPTFGTNQPWAQNADIRVVESPDLIAYLLSEGMSLVALAELTRDSVMVKQAGAHTGALPEDAAQAGAHTGAPLQELVVALKSHLDALWLEDRYAYRDRDTHSLGTAGITLLEDARAEGDLMLSTDLTPPARLLVRITVGTGKPPRLTLHLHGKGISGAPLHETAAFTEIGWYRGYGVYTSQHAYTHIERVQIEGLSRVYRVDMYTLELSRLDINAVLPILSGGLWLEEKTEALVKHITDPAAFALPNGIPMTAASDPAFNAAENGGVWLFWLTLIGEGLIQNGGAREAAELARRILTAQAAVLLQDGVFHEFYHSEAAQGSGESGHLNGIAPLHLLNKLWSMWVVSPTQVYIDSGFVWDTPVTIRQHGVKVTRSAEGTNIMFASGHTVELPLAVPPQWVKDAASAPQTPEIAPTTPIRPPTYPGDPTQPSGGRVVIQVQVEPGDVAKPKPESDESA